MKRFLFILVFFFTLTPFSFGQDKERLAEGFRCLSKNKPEIAVSYFYEVSKNGDREFAPYALYGMAKAYFDMKEYDYAAYEFQQFIDNYTDNVLFENASYYLSRSLLRSKKPSMALSQAETHLSLFPDSIWSDDIKKIKNVIVSDDYSLAKNKKRDAIIYEKARLYGRTKKFAQAIKLLENLIAEYPNSDYADDALYYLGAYHEALDETDEALSSFLRIIYDYPKSYYVDGAIFKAGTIYYNKGDYDAAYATYSQAKINQTGTETPICLLLWGTTAEKLGQTSSAAGIYYFISENFDHTYPSYRARERLASLGYAEPETKEIESKNTASAEKVFLSSDKPIIPVQYVEKKINKAILSGKVDQIPAEGWMINYPKSFWDDVVSASNKNGIDPYLTLAVMREESRFDPMALSRSKAHGLMQIMPSTGKIIAKKLEISPFKRSKMYESATNINMGTYYLSNLIERFDGNVFLAVAGYNGGPARVKKWVNEWYGGDLSKVDIDEFVQKIPIRETRNYVQKVMGSFYEYKRLYGGD